MLWKWLEGAHEKRCVDMVKKMSVVVKPFQFAIWGRRIIIFIQMFQMNHIVVNLEFHTIRVVITCKCSVCENGFVIACENIYTDVVSYPKAFCT